MQAGIKSASKTMAWTKAKKAVVWGTVGLVVLVAILPVQPVKANPAAALAVILQGKPRSSNCPLVAPEIVPRPLMAKCNGAPTS